MREKLEKLKANETVRAQCVKGTGAILVREVEKRRTMGECSSQGGRILLRTNEI